MMHGFEMDGGHGLWMVFWWILWIAIVVFAVYGVSRLARKDDRETASDILKKRYAQGDITKEEFDEKMKEITRG